MEIVSGEYNWDVIDKNIFHVTKYVGAAVPAVCVTGVAYVTLPQVLAAGTFALAGPAASAGVYMAANIIIICGGTCKTLKDMAKISFEGPVSREVKGA